MRKVLVARCKILCRKEINRNIYETKSFYLMDIACSIVLTTKNYKELVLASLNEKVQGAGVHFYRHSPQYPPNFRKHCLKTELLNHPDRNG